MVRILAGFVVVGCVFALSFGCTIDGAGLANGDADMMDDGMNGDADDMMDASSGRFAANLTGDQEVPAIDTNAGGSGTFEFNGDETSISFDISVTGLSGDATSMHFHMAPAGANGGVAVDLSASISNSGDGSMTATGSADISAAVADAIRAGEIYLNVHTAANPAGEIRGQLEASE